jgi:hypothetical protein
VELKLMAGDRAGAKGIKNILKAEETKEMLRQLKWAKPQTDAGITAVRVPTDGDYSTAHCKNCNSWQTLVLIIRNLFSGYTQLGRKPKKGITCPIPEEPGYYYTIF